MIYHQAQVKGFSIYPSNRNMGKKDHAHIASTGKECKHMHCCVMPHHVCCLANGESMHKRGHDVLTRVLRITCKRNPVDWAQALREP